MDNISAIQQKLVFGLDIGTRNIVGVVGNFERGKFKIRAMAQEEHETRAMLDGQIHDIYKVGDTIRKVKNSLEEQLGFKLTDVCIAAAGRVLKTINSSAETTFDEEVRVTSEHIYSLNLLAVEEAHKKINDNSSDARFYCVGNTPVRYQLNGYDINNLEGHKAYKIAVELIATFLPEEVVDGLYEAVEYAGLNVASLTLEPIAAMNIAIPEQYRLLNIGLIDVGAGTSDICLTKDGSIIAYGMIPYAGDEITEKIAKHYLVDFNTAEKIKVSASNKKKGFVTFKDIMGLPQKVSANEIKEVADDVIKMMAKAAADKIIELNGGKSTNAVFVVGGGGKMAGYTEYLAKDLGIASERVAVRGEEVLTTVDFEATGFKKDSLYVTPVGICTNYFNQKNNFVFVTVNDERVKLYDNNHLTVVDAVMQVGYPNEKLFPRRGKEINFMINGQSRLIRGSAGEGAVISLNGRPANLNSLIVKNDEITIKESTIGEAASMTIGQLPEFDSSITFVVNDKTINCPRFAYVNGELKSEFYDICDGDKIRMENFYTVKQLFEFIDYDVKQYDVYVNNEPADSNTKVYENFSVRLIDNSSSDNNENVYNTGNAQEDSDISDDAERSIDNMDNMGENAYNTVDVTDNNTENVNKDKSGDTSADEALKVPVTIHITVNNTPVVLSGKSDYILVDLFQFYDFDLSQPKGNIVLKHNGLEGIYTSPLNDGDVVEIYWEDIKR